MRPVHGQPAATPLTERQRSERKRSADLCRRDPATWSAMVRYSDQLIAAGGEPQEARSEALEAYAPLPQQDDGE